jgi:hypothetical protein
MEYAIIALTVICIGAMLFNRKIYIIKIFVEQIKAFKNDKTEKISFFDIISFVVCPIILSSIITYYYNFIIDETLAEILVTAFTLIFTLLFAFEAILVSKKDSQNKVEQEVVKETFVSIVTASVLSLTANIMSIMIMFVNYDIVIKILSTVILTLSFMTIMLLLMIIKRTFLVYMNDSK